jgi:hypothetical protein
MSGCLVVGRPRRESAPTIIEIVPLLVFAWFMWNVVMPIGMDQ